MSFERKLNSSNYWIGFCNGHRKALKVMTPEILNMQEIKSNFTSKILNSNIGFPVIEHGLNQVWENHYSVIRLYSSFVQPAPEVVNVYYIIFQSKYKYL